MTLNARQEMLDSLCTDLLNSGWDKPNLTWFILGSDGDEYLDFIAEFVSEPAHWMLQRAEEGTLRDSVRGIVVSYESWTYPKALRDMLHENQALQEDGVSLAYRSLVAPSDHPQREQVRTIVLVARDGEVLRCDRYSDQDETLHHGHPEGVALTGPTGADLVDQMRTLLGINSPHDLKHQLARMLASSGQADELLRTAAAQQWSLARMAAEIFKAAPAEMQARLAEMLPPEVKELLDDDTT